MHGNPHPEASQQLSVQDLEFRQGLSGQSPGKKGSGFPTCLRTLGNKTHPRPGLASARGLHRWSSTERPCSCRDRLSPAASHGPHKERTSSGLCSAPERGARAGREESKPARCPAPPSCWSICHHGLLPLLCQRHTPGAWGQRRRPAHPGRDADGPSFLDQELGLRSSSAPWHSPLWVSLGFLKVTFAFPQGSLQ